MQINFHLYAERSPTKLIVCKHGAIRIIITLLFRTHFMSIPLKIQNNLAFLHVA